MSQSHVIQLGLVQHACSSDVKANVDKAVKMIRDAAKRGARVIATQELFAGTYFCQIEDDARFALAEPIPGPTSQRLSDLAKELGIYITASLFERRTAGIYHNTSVMLSPSGELVGKYRKMHIPDDPRFYEKYYFTPGDLGWQTQNLTLDKSNPVTTGMLVCWDQWYPEAARLTAMRGAQVLFYPTAIGWYHGETPEDRKQQREAWHTIQRSHAIANGVYVAAINRVGVEEDLEFWGGSFVCDPGGVVIAEASRENEEALVVECDLSRIEAIRKGWPFFRDRRIDAYSPITQRFLD
ncbi:MAG: acyltransferase [Phycisphaera sp.]|nr:acyltransferase [Phycisphaera sp.]